MTDLISNEGVCRTAPATPGLLTTRLQVVLPTQKLGVYDKTKLQVVLPTQYCGPTETKQQFHLCVVQVGKMRR